MERKSWIVTEKQPRDGETQCVYCPSKIGEEHAADCVLRSRTITARVTINFTDRVPEHWDDGMVAFHIEEHWCVGNLVDELIRLNEMGCLCPHVENIEWTGEATPEDEERSQNFIMEDEPRTKRGDPPECSG